MAKILAELIRMGLGEETSIRMHRIAYLVRVCASWIIVCWFALTCLSHSSRAGDREPAEASLDEILGAVKEIGALSHQLRGVQPPNHCSPSGSAVGGKRSRAALFGSPGQAPRSPVARAGRSSNPTGQTIYDYTKTINFKDGDLLYGLQTTRQKTLEQLKKMGSEKKAYTIDVFNNLIYYHMRGQAGALEADPKTVASSVASMVKKGELDRSDQERFKLYYSYLRNHLTPDEQRQDYDDFVRSACIQGIFFGKDYGHTIHFILDGVDRDSVINPQNKDHNSYTNSELRAIPRRLRSDPQILNAVKFYENGSLVEQGEKFDLIDSFSLSVPSAAAQVQPSQGHLPGTGDAVGIRKRLDF